MRVSVGMSVGRAVLAAALLVAGALGAAAQSGSYIEVPQLQAPYSCNVTNGALVVQRTNKLQPHEISPNTYSERPTRRCYRTQIRRGYIWDSVELTEVNCRDQHDRVEAGPTQYKFDLKCGGSTVPWASFVVAALAGNYGTRSNSIGLFNSSIIYTTDRSDLPQQFLDECDQKGKPLKEQGSANVATLEKCLLLIRSPKIDSVEAGYARAVAIDAVVRTVRGAAEVSSASSAKTPGSSTDSRRPTPTSAPAEPSYLTWPILDLFIADWMSILALVVALGSATTLVMLGIGYLASGRKSADVMDFPSQEGRGGLDADRAPRHVAQKSYADENHRMQERGRNAAENGVFAGNGTGHVGSSLQRNGVDRGGPERGPPKHRPLPPASEPPTQRLDERRQDRNAAAERASGLPERIQQVNERPPSRQNPVLDPPPPISRPAPGIAGGEFRQSGEATSDVVRFQPQAPATPQSFSSEPPAPRYDAPRFDAQANQPPYRPAPEHRHDMQPPPVAAPPSSRLPVTVLPDDINGLTTLFESLRQRWYPADHLTADEREERLVQFAAIEAAASLAGLRISNGR